MHLGSEKDANRLKIILGASSPQQIHENSKDLKLIRVLTPELMEEIETILDNAPVLGPTYGRDR